MDQRCVFCGRKANTREHVIPKCFLDIPYPKDLLTVPSCNICNNSFSEDEQYLMYLIDFLKSAEMNQGEFTRIKIRKTYEHSQSLEGRMFDSLNVDRNGNAYFAIEVNRVIRVLTKIALCMMVHHYRHAYSIDMFSITYSFMAQLTECEQQRIRNEFYTEYQVGRFAYKIYNEYELAMIFSDFLLVYATVPPEIF